MQRTHFPRLPGAPTLGAAVPPPPTGGVPVGGLPSVAGTPPPPAPLTAANLPSPPRPGYSSPSRAYQAAQAREVQHFNNNQNNLLGPGVSRRGIHFT